MKSKPAIASPSGLAFSTSKLLPARFTSASQRATSEIPKESCLLTHLLTCLLAYLFTYLLVTYLLIYLPAHLLTEGDVDAVAEAEEHGDADGARD